MTSKRLPAIFVCEYLALDFRITPPARGVRIEMLGEGIDLAAWLEQGEGSLSLSCGEGKRVRKWV
jgi:hypothetical protein